MKCRSLVHLAAQYHATLDQAVAINLPSALTRKYASPAPRTVVAPEDAVAGAILSADEHLGDDHEISRRRRARR